MNPHDLISYLNGLHLTLKFQLKFFTHHITYDRNFRVLRRTEYVPSSITS